MADFLSIETIMRDQEVPVKGTLGYLYRIRNDRGFYEAKVALLVQPDWHRGSTPYLLGQAKDNYGNTEDGAWIKFAYSAEELVSQWQPRVGDRVLILTFGDYGYPNGRIIRLSSSYDNDARIAEESTINGPFRSLSGGMA